jgi:hypothetical protein
MFPYAVSAAHRGHVLERHHGVGVVFRDHEYVEVAVPQVHECAGAQRPHRRMRAD